MIAIKKLIATVSFLVALLVGLIALSGVTGCNTQPKTRSVEAAGMYANPATETLAIGKVDVVAIPEGEESAIIKYSEDNAWLCPSLKLHEIGVYLTGTNSVASASNIVESICKAFVAVAPTNRIERVE